jgi:hypothetical protein
MPTIVVPGALLAMSATLDNNTGDNLDDDKPSDSLVSDSRPPWCWTAWQERTKVYALPFTPTHGSNSLWKTPESTLAVWTFANNFWDMIESEQLKYIRRKLTDNDRVGRVLWLDWVKNAMLSWGIRDTIEKVLVERGFDPYSVMKRYKTNTVCVYAFMPPPYSHSPQYSSRTSLSLKCQLATNTLRVNCSGKTHLPRTVFV